MNSFGFFDNDDAMNKFTSFILVKMWFDEWPIAYPGTVVDIILTKDVMDSLLSEKDTIISFVESNSILDSHIEKISLPKLWVQNVPALFNNESRFKAAIGTAMYSGRLTCRISCNWIWIVANEL